MASPTATGSVGRSIASLGIFRPKDAVEHTLGVVGDVGWMLLRVRAGLEDDGEVGSLPTSAVGRWGAAVATLTAVMHERSVFRLQTDRVRPVPTYLAQSSA